MRYYDSDTDKLLENLNSDAEGISTEEAARRLAQNGANKLDEKKGDSLLKRFLGQLSDPMIIILLVAAAVSGVLAYYEGESFADVIIILAVVVINSVLGVYQESKAEAAIEALQSMSAAQSKVLRGGVMAIVRSEDLVVGDIVLLEAGDAVPADGRVLEAASLQIEEAALTGESVPVTKDTATLPSEEITLGDRKNMVYMGSTVVYGRGKILVCETGMGTQMGKIAHAISEASEGQTPLQKKLSQLSKTLTWLVLGICAVIFAVQLLRDGVSTDIVIHSFMVSVSLAVAAIPEGLAAVVTVVLSIGVTNMAKKNAIIRRLTAVETLGCAQIICSDKTGTLTQNRMTVKEHYGSEAEILAEAMALCTDADAGEDGRAVGEPTECALVDWASTLSLKKHDLEAKLPRVAEAPFDSLRKMMTTVHKKSAGTVQYTKGAPDEVLARCVSYLKDGVVLPLDDKTRKEIESANKGMADKALRVLAAATREHDTVPTDLAPETLERDMCFMGLAGMIDPVRPEAKIAIGECRSAGIRPIMITGDHVDTASAIARELGIFGEGDRAVTGAELSAMSEEEFLSIFKDVSVYARVQPEHKTLIVKAWRGAGFVTAMTGDGVNDAPSIKTADIGVGMGITGTDVTKNVADMVLADDNFATIVGAVEEGRRIYDNIRKAIRFLLGSNMSEVMSIFIATLLGFTILQPVHLLWINLVTDTFPALALGMERGEDDIMKRAPRDAADSVFAGGMVGDIIYQGAMVMVLTMSAYFSGLYMETGSFAIANSQLGVTMAFLTMNLSEIFHSFNMRSERGSIFRMHGMNKALNIGAIASFLATLTIIEVPFLAAAFGLVNIEVTNYLIAIGLAICVIPIVEIVKAIQRSAKK